MTVRRLGLAWCVAGALALAVPATGAAQSKTKPKNATAKCEDGTYSTAKSKQGACSGHGGVATWYADEKPAKESKKESKSAAKESKKESRAAAKEAKSDEKESRRAKKESKTAAKEGKSASKSAERETKSESKSAEKESKSAEKSTTPTGPRPSGAPSDATAQCNDGTYSFAKNHRGACSGHQGVKTWFK